MRIGCVKFLNARPLDTGFRKGQVFKTEHLILVEDTPASLVELLKKGELDAALISSIECFRNEDFLGWNETVGVCAKDFVRSILYIRKKGDTTEPKTLYLDRGSRSSHALLQILLHEQGIHPEARIEDPKNIPSRIQKKVGGLLIGDAALDFIQKDIKEEFDIFDLAHMWRVSQNLPFVFALWAYPRKKPVEDHIFESSLDVGLASIDEIVAQFSFDQTREYLTKTLHYRLGNEEKLALRKFRELSERYGLLSP